MLMITLYTFAPIHRLDCTRSLYTSKAEPRPRLHLRAATGESSFLWIPLEDSVILPSSRLNVLFSFLQAGRLCDQLPHARA